MESFASEAKLIIFAVIFIVAFLILSRIFPSLLASFIGGETQAQTNYYQSLGFYLVITFAILLVVSGFLPYNWGKITREIAYLVLFVLVLVTEMRIVSPFIHKINIAVGDCENVFFPQGSGASNAIFNTIDYASCVLTGYYPKESPKTANVAWATFYVFYLILPFVFVWVIIHGIMQGMGMESWFGGFGKNAIRLLSFIIAMFATRVLMGEVLLEFLGYGAWGLVGVFGAIFIVGGLKHVIENWYSVEAMSAETRKAIENEMKLRREALKNLHRWINKSKSDIDLNELVTRGTLAYHKIFNYLPDEIKAEVESIIKNPRLSFVQKKNKLLKLLVGRR